MGRGAEGEKSGMAIAAIIPLALIMAGINLKGDLTIASAADEEQGGGNGSVALLADGINSAAALYLDGTIDQAFWISGLG